MKPPFRQFPLSLLVAICVIGTGITYSNSAIQSQCNCGPTKTGDAHSISYRWTNPHDVPLSGVQSKMSSAGGKWVNAFANRSQSISIDPGAGGLEIIITTGLNGTMMHEPGKIFVAEDLITRVDPPYSGDYIEALFIHEVGHELGFAQVTASGCENSSVMSNTNEGSYRLNITSCDLQQVTHYYGPVRRDDDSDGWSPDDPSPDTDCDDGPGGYDTNPGISISCELADQDHGADHDCSGDPDWEELNCDEEWNPDPGSPIVIDVLGNGFNLTNKAGGAIFDLNGDGVAYLMPWTAQASDDAWLALDRNGNTTIDNGTELFGNFTPQPASSEANGFLALAVFDAVVMGGNGDGWMDRGDAVFSRLKLWVDANHDGASQINELKTLDGAGLQRISLDYRESRHKDRWGNEFRYRAKIIAQRARDNGPWAYDVFLGPGKRKQRTNAGVMTARQTFPTRENDQMSRHPIVKK